MSETSSAAALILTVLGGGLLLALFWNVAVAPLLFGYRALAGTGWTTRRTGWASWGIAFLLGVATYSVWQVL